MIKRIASWFADHSVEIVGMAIGVGGIGVLANGFADLGSMWRDHAWAMVTWSLACLLVGVAIGDSSGMSRYLRARHEERVAAERAEQDAKARREAEDASRRAAARERVLGLSYEDKLLLSEVSQRGFLDTEQGCDEDVRDLLWNVDDLVSGTEVGDYVWRIRLTDYGRYAVSVSGDILDEAVRP